MQLQGDVGIFSSVVAGFIEPDLVEGQLLFAFTGDVLEMHRLALQVLVRQGIHIVTCGGGIEHIGFEHGVVPDTRQRDSVVFQHVHIVFEVLTDFFRRLAFEQGPQLFQYGFTRELFWRALVIVAERHIGRLARLYRKRHPHHLRFHIIKVGGFGVEGKQLRAF